MQVDWSPLQVHLCDSLVWYYLALMIVNWWNVAQFSKGNKLVWSCQDIGVCPEVLIWCWCHAKFMFQEYSAMIKHQLYWPPCVVAFSHHTDLHSGSTHRHTLYIQYVIRCISPDFSCFSEIFTSSKRQVFWPRSRQLPIRLRTVFCDFPGYDNCMHRDFLQGIAPN